MTEQYFDDSFITSFLEHKGSNDSKPDQDPIKEALLLIIDREYDIPVVDALHALESLRDRVAGLEAAIKAALPLETFWLDYGRAKIAADAKPLSSVME